MNEVTYTKLSELVDRTFKVEKIFEPKFKAWDNETRKMLISDAWQLGYQKKYTVDTDKGRMDLSSSQVANMLEAVVSDGRADLNGREFKVKSNGKTGMDIRYFFNPAKETTEEELIPEEWNG